MRTCVILLRGVTPGGKNKVPMAHLRNILAGDGFGNVRTYIQSGNVLVDTVLPAGEVSLRIHTLIKESIGPDLVVVIRTAEQLKEVLINCPFQRDHDLSRVFFVLFAEIPAIEKVNELLAQDFGTEELAIRRDAAYMYIPGPYGRGRLSNNFLEQKLGISATMRNYNTLSRLIEMSKEQEPGVGKTGR